MIRKLMVVLSGFALAVTVGACGAPGADGSGGGDRAVTTELAALVQKIGESTADTPTRARPSRRGKVAAEQGDPELTRALDSLGVKEFPVELWTNEDDLPVRMRMEPPMTDPNTGKPVKAVVLADYTKWGKPVVTTCLRR